MFGKCRDTHKPRVRFQRRRRPPTARITLAKVLSEQERPHRPLMDVDPRFHLGTLPVDFPMRPPQPLRPPPLRARPPRQRRSRTRWLLPDKAPAPNHSSSPLARLPPHCTGDRRRRIAAPPCRCPSPAPVAKAPLPGPAGPARGYMPPTAPPRGAAPGRGEGLPERRGRCVKVQRAGTRPARSRGRWSRGRGWGAPNTAAILTSSARGRAAIPPPSHAIGASPAYTHPRPFSTSLTGT